MSAARKTVHIVQGEFQVSADPEVELSTILGSCIAACLHDPVARIGGMNHFLLPGSDPDNGRNIKYGVHSMERLINAMLRAGAQRHRIQVRLFGGANVVERLGGIGADNARFARRFVEDEELTLVGEDLGGRNGRRIRFHPTTGQAQMSAFSVAPLGPPATRAPEPPLRPAAGGRVELF